MRIQNLHEIILALYNRPNDKDYCENNPNAFAKLIKFLDWSQSLMKEAPDNGRKEL